MTQVEQRKNIQMSLKAQIIEMLFETELHYCYFQYNQGLRYLKTYIGDDSYKLEGSRTFWNWWKNQWSLRDEEYTILLASPESISYNPSLRLMKLMYADLHNGKYLANSLRPHRFIMEQTYTEMIDQVIKEETGATLQTRASGNRAPCIKSTP